MHDEIRASSDEIFSLRLQMKLNPPPLTLRSKISSRSDFIHDSGFIPTKADLVEKSTCFRKCFFLVGDGGFVTTSSLRSGARTTERAETGELILGFASAGLPLVLPSSKNGA
jgi:hypothetical protein